MNPAPANHCTALSPGNTHPYRAAFCGLLYHKEGNLMRTKNPPIARQTAAMSGRSRSVRSPMAARISVMPAAGLKAR